MMYNNSFFRIILLTISVAFLSSCDKDFNSVGGDLIGDEHFGLEQKSFNVLSYNQKVEAVQSNNLPINALGVYEDPNFGTTTANFVTQVVLATGSINPVIGANPEIENVVLSIPYTSVASTDATTGNVTYTLNDVYGPDAGKIKLSVYENGYFMRDLDPLTGFLEPQKFYTNQGAEFESLKKATLLNDATDVSQNEAFFFDAKEQKDSVLVGGVNTLRPEPEMRLFLNKAYFKTRILDAAKKSDGTDPGKLTNNDVFKDYFRGLYFKVEKSGSSPGRLALMNFKSGLVTINYKEDLVTTTTVNGVSTPTTTRVNKSIVLNLTGNTTSLLTNDLTTAVNYKNATDNPNDTAGDDKLYVKGGEGSMAVLDLFDKTDVLSYNDEGVVGGPNLVPDQLDELRRKDPVTGKRILINEANLVFHVDGATMGTNKIPNRVYLYDFNNSRPIVDYVIGASGGTNADPEIGMLIYSGILNTTKEEDNTYKVRITNHIRNLINNKDSTNVKLGVVVTKDILNSTMNNLRTAKPKFTKVPQASVMSQLGVVLFGGTASVPEAKRLKLEIYYTKPN